MLFGPGNMGDYHQYLGFLGSEWLFPDLQSLVELVGPCGPLVMGVSWPYRGTQLHSLEL